MHYQGERLCWQLPKERVYYLIELIKQVDPLPGFKYSYSLFVDGKSYEQFTESQAKALKTWEVNLGDNFYRIVLGNELIFRNWIQKIKRFF